jgi:hypothetical protein
VAQPNPLERPAFYALAPGGWRDLVTLLHPPYTAWHLSYVAIGAAVAPTLYAGRLAAALAAFFLGVGVCAHALDELNGRPLRTRLSDRMLVVLAVVSLSGAVAIGVAGAVAVSASVVPFVLAGAFLVVAYNLELFGGRFHSDVWFALAWGAFPALTGYWINALELRVEGLLTAAACFLLSVAQRRLSTPARELRRRTVSVSGRQQLTDGTSTSHGSPPRWTGRCARSPWRSSSSPSGSSSRASESPRPLHRHGQRLDADESLERGDERAEPADVQRGTAVDRSDAHLAHQRRTAALAGLCPGGEQHPRGPGHLPTPELVRIARHGEVAAHRPDAAEEARQQIGRSLVEHDEGVAAEHVVEGQAARQPGDPGADQPAQ